jgi:hypothetical protein
VKRESSISVFGSEAHAWLSVVQRPARIVVRHAARDSVLNVAQVPRRICRNAN